MLHPLWLLNKMDQTDEQMNRPTDIPIIKATLLAWPTSQMMPQTAI